MDNNDRDYTYIFNKIFTGTFYICFLCNKYYGY